MRSAEIPVAHTPAGGYGEQMPAPVLEGCEEALVEGAPDMRGRWRVESVEVDGKALEQHPILGHLQRIEQCGDRVVITAGGVIHDMRCDGVPAHGVNDVAEFDFKTPITVVASFEAGVHTLRPVGIPILVTRHLESEELVWCYLGFTARLRRVADER